MKHKRTFLLDAFAILFGLAFLSVCIYAQNENAFDIEAFLKLTL